MKVSFRNPKSGEVKQVKVGWSWTLFFFAGLFGIPLFMRRLNIWGAVMAVLCLAAPFSMGATYIPALVLQIYLAIKGNELTAKNYLEHGWEFAEPDSDMVRFARVQWGLSAPGNSSQAKAA
jgi:hypothetical protein